MASTAWSVRAVWKLWLHLIQKQYAFDVSMFLRKPVLGVTNTDKNNLCRPLPLHFFLLPKHSSSQIFSSVNNSLTVHLFKLLQNTEFTLIYITGLHMAKVFERSCHTPVSQYSPKNIRTV